MIIQIDLQHTINCTAEQVQLKLTQAMNCGNWQQAQLIVNSLLTQLPQLNDAILTLCAKVLLQAGDYQNLLTLCKHWQKINIEQAYYYQAIAFRFLRQPQQAWQSIQTLLTTNPKQLAAIKLAITLATELNLKAQLAPYIQSLFKTEQFDSELLYSLQRIGIPLKQKQIDYLQIQSHLLGNQAIYANFSLFNYYHQQHNFSAAKSYLIKANQLKRNTISFNIAQIQREYAWLKQSNFTTNSINHHSASKPIFICGMPRSGTSLLEQLVCQHTEITAADELTALPKALSFALRQNLTNDAIAPMIAKQYMAQTQAFQNKQFFTDKRPLNFQLIGIIVKAFPNSKILYCQRDPLDVIFSCYRHLFAEGNQFSYELTELTQFYIEHHKLMQHWQQQYPDNIIVVNYASLIKQPQHYADAIYNALNLTNNVNWQKPTFDFQSPSYSLSNIQLQKGLSNQHFNAWKNYAELMQPVKQQLTAANIEFSDFL